MTSGSDDPLRLLAVLLRLRPGTRRELAAIRSLPVVDLDRSLAELEAAGFVVRDGDRLGYPDPELAVRDAARTLAERIAGLPELRRHWIRGGPQPARLEVELVHGHEEQWRAWARHAAATPPRAPLNLYPSLEVLRDVIAPQLPDAAEPFREGMRDARAVVPASAVITDDDRAVIERLQSVGMRIRLARRLESWVYSDPEVLCALPLTWGEHPPTSIMIVHDPAIRGIVAAYAEQVWALSRPYAAARPEWHDVLGNLALGIPDAVIAASLGVSRRTVERRIAEAMLHYRVGTRFELGAAWSLEQVDVW